MSTPQPHLGVNEQTFLDYIQEMAKKHHADTLSIEWVKWMLVEISRCYRDGSVLNPEWLRLACIEPWVEPPMFII